MTRVQRWLLIGAAVVVGLGGMAALVWGGYEVAPDLLAPTIAVGLAVGWSFIGVGIVVWSGGNRRIAVLMMLLGFTWFARYIVAIDNTLTFSVGVLLGSVYLSLLVHLLVSYPTGRLQGSSRRVIVAVGYLLSAPLDGVFLWLAGAQRGRGDGPPPDGIVIQRFPDGLSPDLVSLLVQVVVVLLCLAVIVVTIAYWRRSNPPLRRRTAPAVLGGLAIVVTIMLSRGAFLLFIDLDALVVLIWAAEVVLVGWPVALLVGLLRTHLDRAAVGRLLIELGEGLPLPDRLRASLSAALHDPSVQIGYWVDELSTFVDSRGHPVVIDNPGGSRMVTYLERDGRRIAALSHDANVEPELVRVVAAGAALAVDNERLSAELSAQLREVRESRARIVEAADRARRRVERDLHDGSQQRLLSVALALRLARNELVAGRTDIAELVKEARAELTAAMGELTALARGIYPAILTEKGLRPALVALADRSPVPATVRGDVPERLPAVVAQTAYFLVSEALTNAGKHAECHNVGIRITEVRSTVMVEVADDGRGGASMSGSGLRGLADRIAAVGGRLRVFSPPGQGTRLVAELPCG